MSPGATTSIPTAKGAARRIPLSGWRGEPPVREPAERCPYCGQTLGVEATPWCPAFDELLRETGRGLLAG
jgi:hypothetical protein